MMCCTPSITFVMFSRPSVHLFTNRWKSKFDVDPVTIDIDRSSNPNALARSTKVDLLSDLYGAYCKRLWWLAALYWKWQNYFTKWSSSSNDFAEPISFLISSVSTPFLFNSFIIVCAFDWIFWIWLYVCFMSRILDKRIGSHQNKKYLH